MFSYFTTKKMQLKKQNFSLDCYKFDISLKTRMIASFSALVQPCPQSRIFLSRDM